jgi:tRNA(Ile)-lysidine synthetase, N-terminal domain/tRNA(Ile)-lysidine synthetase, C-terminal domain
MAENTIERHVATFLEKEIKLPPPARVVVGFSGGADSVVLLYIMNHLGYDCLATHCNFHLRGDESKRDELFAREFASSAGIPFIKQDFDTHRVASERNISIEMAARDLRYAWFEALREEHQADAVAVAHHQDDSIETLLLNLIRGTGIAGLTGIKPRNKHIVRPLLCINRAEIEQYAQDKGLAYVVDSTNLEDEYTRNRIRHQLIPLFETFNPSAREALLQTMSNMNEAAKIYYFHIEEAKKTVYNKEQGTIDIARLTALPSPEAVLFELLSEYGFNKESVASILQSLDGTSGKEFYSHQYRLIKDRDTLILTPLPEATHSEYSIAEDDTELTVPIHIKIEYLPNTPDLAIKKDPAYAYLDAGKLTFPLTLRRWKSGDRFVPFGMKGSQKLSDYFSNNKFSLAEKENTWLLCSGDDIVWIVGHRISEQHKITKQTKRVVQLSVNINIGSINQMR